MFSRITFLSVLLASTTGFALSLPPRIIEEQKTAGVDEIVLESAKTALGRDLTEREAQAIAKFRAEIETAQSAPQVVVNVFGLFHVNAMACFYGQGSALLSRVGGTGCIDMTYEPGTRYVMTGAEYQTDLGASVEGAIGLLAYAGPASLKPYVGGYGVTGGILGLPIPYFKVGARTKYFANLDKQFMIFAGASLGASGQPLPVNFSVGGISVTKTDWMAGLHGEQVGTPDVSLTQRVREMYGYAVQFFRGEPVTTLRVIIDQDKK